VYIHHYETTAISARMLKLIILVKCKLLWIERGELVDIEKVTLKDSPANILKLFYYEE
jgi:hypothetical protein